MFLSVQHVGRATAKDGFVLQRRPFPLVWPDKDKFGTPYHQTFAGLEPEIRRLLEEKGWTCVLAGDRPKTLPDPQWEKLSSNRTGDQRLLRFVQQHERGLIWYRESKVDIAWLIAQVALAYPKEKIVVMVTRKADAEVIAKRLRRYISNVSLATAHHHPAKPGRVVVVTPSSIGQTGVRAWERTTCICLNPTEVFNVRQDRLSSHDWLPVLKTRLYGLLCEDVLLAPQKLDLLRALFGSQRLFIPRHGYRELPVKVKFWRFKGGSNMALDTPTPELKRQLVWRDHLRNRLIAGLAEAIVNDDDKALAKKYPSLAADLYAKLGRRVAILVENVEHAEQLLKRLPGWAIVAGDVSDASKLSPKAKTALKAGSQPSVQKTQDVIVTTSAFAKIGIVDVLIRADAGVTLPPISS